MAMFFGIILNILEDYEIMGKTTCPLNNVKKNKISVKILF